MKLLVMVTYLLDVGVGTLARMEKLLRTLLKLARTYRKKIGREGFSWAVKLCIQKKVIRTVKFAQKQILFSHFKNQG